VTLCDGWSVLAKRRSRLRSPCHKWCGIVDVFGPDRSLQQCRTMSTCNTGRIAPARTAEDRDADCTSAKAGSDSVALARSVSFTGALGSLACALLSPDAVREAMRALRHEMARPFNLNFFCYAMEALDPAATQRWKRFLRPHYERWRLGLALECDATSKLEARPDGYKHDFESLAQPRGDTGTAFPFLLIAILDVLPYRSGLNWSEPNA
jgi:hypothetical protein